MVDKTSKKTTKNKKPPNKKDKYLERFFGTFLNSRLFWFFFVGIFIFAILISLFLYSSENTESFACQGKVSEDRDGNPGDYKNSYCDRGADFCVDVHYGQDCQDDYRLRQEKKCVKDSDCKKVSCYTHRHCGAGVKDKTKWECVGGSKSKCVVGVCAGVAAGVNSDEPVPENCET